LIAEAETRGIKLPSDLKDVFQNKKTQKWPIAPNGYFLREDGYGYNPSEAQAGFIKSTARNVMIYGPRGCGKSGAG